MAKETKEKDLGKFEVETAEQKSEKRRVAPHLGGYLRFYQADAAAEFPGAWYVIVHRDGGGPESDARLSDVDAAALHDLAKKILAKGKTK